MDSDVSDVVAVVAVVAVVSVVLFLAGVIVAMAVVVLEEDRVFMVLCIAAVVVTGNARCDDAAGFLLLMLPIIPIFSTSETPGNLKLSNSLLGSNSSFSGCPTEGTVSGSGD